MISSYIKLITRRRPSDPCDRVYASATVTCIDYFLSMPLSPRKIGAEHVHPIGFGAMGISAYYGKPDPDEERLKVGHSAS